MKKQWMALLLALVLALAPCCMAVAEEEAEAPAMYALGDVMEDFTAVLTDGTEVSLSGLLAEKKAVMINFWATWCGPCVGEFPEMQEVYDQVSDDLAIVALSVEEEDTMEVIAQFKEDNGLTTLPMGRDEDKLFDRFDSDGIPTSVIVDRNGVICWINIGSLTGDLFTTMFNVYIDPEYTEPVLIDGLPRTEPTVEPISSEELSAALNAEGGELVFVNAGDEYTWPFVAAEEGVCASNIGVINSTCRVDVTVSAEAGQALAYEYKGNVLTVTDCLKVLVNGEAKVYFSGEAADWTTGCVTFDEAGEYTVSFCYDRSTYSEGVEGEFLALRNVRLTSAEEALALMPQYPRALEGKEVGYEVISEGARVGTFSFKSEYSMDYNMVVANGSTLDLRLLIGPDVNVYSAAYVSPDFTYTMLPSLPCDETGYPVHMELPEEEDAEPLFLYLMVDTFSEEYDYIMALVFANEAQLEATVAMYNQSYVDYGMEGSCEWSYSEENRVVEDLSVKICQYAVAVTDAEGNPVEGVAVQFCDDATCSVVNTDATGVAVFEGEAYPYEVHILKVPEGFAKVEEAFTMEPEGDILEVTLTKAE